MIRWCADNCATTLEDRRHQPQSLLNLQDGQRKPAAKEEEPWKQVVQRNKSSKCKENQRQVMAVQDKNYSTLVK